MFSNTTQPAHNRVSLSYYPLALGTFCALLLISNVAAIKLIKLGSLVFDGGALLFPLTYIIGDLLAEVWGFAAARRAIILGFVLGAVASLSWWLVQLAPPAAGWDNQAAFEAVLGFVPRIVVASLAGYLVGQLLNAAALVRIRRLTRGRALWARLIGSTLLGEAADTVVFCTIAFLGVITGSEFLNYLITGYVYKCVIEVIFLPATYAVVRLVKRHEQQAGHTTAPEPSGGTSGTDHQPLSSC
ncbi:MAG: queuosine precursor transporter [Bifidobacteriaceae bacterium]|jgi:uncharacterized integral membrane protein (TIGR00697 family)|nr:queuosine precursor transporter [Bifidobacteriaceae bacterium]